MASRLKSKTVPASPNPRKPLAVAAAGLLWFSFVFGLFYVQSGFRVEILSYLIDQYSQIHFSPYLWKASASLGLVSLIALASYRGGHRFLSFFMPEGSFSRLEDQVFSTAVGLGLLAQAIFVLGVFHLWYAKAFCALLAVFALAGLLKSPRSIVAPHKSEALFSGWAPLWTALLFVLAFIFGLAILSPEIFYDSLYYHLAVPNLYLIAHRMYNIPTLLFSNFVMTLQMLYGLSLGIGNVLTAKILYGLIALLLGGSFLAFGQRFLTAQAGLISALVFFTIPMVGLNMGTAGVEIGWSLFLFLSVFALARSTSDGRRPWLALAGLLTGISASCKVPGFAFIPIGIGFVLWRDYRGPHQRPYPWSDILFYALPALLPIAPFLIRNFVYHHNPVYPFLGTRWGYPQIDPLHWSIFISDNLPPWSLFLGHAKGFLHFLIQPWTISLNGRNRGDYLGPVYLMAIGLLVAAPSSNSTISMIRRYAAFLLLFWSFTSTVPRFALPALAVLAPAVADSIVTFLKSPKLRYPMVAVLSAAFLLNSITFYAAFFQMDGWRVPGGLITEEEFLSGEHIDYPSPPYDAITWMNQQLPPTSKVLYIGEARSFYTKLPVIASSVADPQPLVEYSKRAKNGNEMAALLAQDGVTHLFLNCRTAFGTAARSSFSWDPQSWKVFDDFWSHHLRLIWKKEDQLRTQKEQRLYVYEILNDKDAAAPHEPPFNFFIHLAPAGAA